jgi:hypothetical protein
MTPASVHIGGSQAKSAGMAVLKESIISALVYFDIFRYPLRADEIRTFLDRQCSEIHVHEALAELLKEGRVFVFNNFFSLQDNPLLAVRRKEGNARAEKLLKKAGKIGRFLYHFPFVRGVAVSGSLSKNYADPRADIDFFIITKAKRLWIARTIMHLYKKLTFLTGRQHYYCMNYYLDENAFYLEEQNIFSAIEIKTLLPVCGNDAIDAFFRANNWTDEWFPACAYRQQEKRNPRTFFKRILEWFLSGRQGDRIEKSLFTLTQKRWQQKENRGKKNVKGQQMGFICGRHFAMSNPGHFREKVLHQYNQQLAVHRDFNGIKKNYTISVVR